MFDIAPTELLVVAIVALVVIGPKDLPKALRFVGNWVGKARRMAAHFRAGIDTMVREAELEDLKKDWEAQNRRIMEQFPNADDMSPIMRETNPGFPAESASGEGGKSPEAGSPVIDGPVIDGPVTDGMISGHEGASVPVADTTQTDTGPSNTGPSHTGQPDTAKPSEHKTDGTA